MRNVKEWRFYVSSIFYFQEQYNKLTFNKSNVWITILNKTLSAKNKQITKNMIIIIILFESYKFKISYNIANEETT